MTPKVLLKIFRRTKKFDEPKKLLLPQKQRTD
jgi:hypothetical protein